MGMMETYYRQMAATSLDSAALYRTPRTLSHWFYYPLYTAGGLVSSGGELGKDYETQALRVLTYSLGK